MLTGRNGERGEALVAEISSAGGDVAFVASDLRDAASLDALVHATQQRFGGLTTLVNNAALTALELGDAPVHQLEDAAIAASLGVNIEGLLKLCRAAMPAICEAQGGSVIHLSSGCAVKGVPGTAVYSASKGAMNALTRQMARDYGPQGVRVNCIISGLVLSNPETDAMLARPGVRDAFAAMNCLPWFGVPEDTAAACVFLASDEARYITGSELTVDGGATC